MRARLFPACGVSFFQVGTCAPFVIEPISKPGHIFARDLAVQLGDAVRVRGGLQGERREPDPAVLHDEVPAEPRLLGQLADVAARELRLEDLVSLGDRGVRGEDRRRTAPAPAPSSRIRSREAKAACPSFRW